MASRTLFVALSILLAGAALAQEREWTFETGETEAFLSFGVPETDDIGLSFWCTLRSGEIKLFLPEANGNLRPGGTTKVRIKAGTTDITSAAKMLPNEESGGVSAESQFSIDAPLFAALQREDRFSVWVEKETWTFPLDSADVGALLRACGKI